MPALIKALQDSLLPPELTALLQESEIPALLEQPVDLDLEEQLDQLLKNNPTLTPACRSGLWLLVGNLELSHGISQELKTREGSYWHGIMHRRERDFWNSKYWFQKVGDHPVLSEIAKEMRSVLSDSSVATLCSRRGKFEPSQFTDLCAALDPADAQSYAELQIISWIEWQSLFAFCFEKD